MIVVAVFFTYEIPDKENQVLRDELKRVSNEQEYQNEFFAEMVELDQMIDSLKVQGQFNSFENQRISTKILELQKNIPSGSSSHIPDMHMTITQLYVELLNAQNKLISLEGSETNIAEVVQAYEDCKKELTQTQLDLIRLSKNLN